MVSNYKAKMTVHKIRASISPPIPTPTPNFTWLKEAWPFCRAENTAPSATSVLRITYKLYPTVLFSVRDFLWTVCLCDIFYFRCFESALGRFHGSLSHKAAFLSLQFSVSISYDPFFLFLNSSLVWLMIQHTKAISLICLFQKGNTSRNLSWVLSVTEQYPCFVQV